MNHSPPKQPPYVPLTFQAINKMPKSSSVPVPNSSGLLRGTNAASGRSRTPGHNYASPGPDHVGNMNQELQPSSGLTVNTGPTSGTLPGRQSRRSSDFRGREWSVARITGKEEGKDGVQYRVQFETSKVLESDITRRSNGVGFVAIRGRPWRIVREETAAPEPGTGHHRRWVDWEQCWFEAAALPNAGRAIADFETQEHARTPVASTPHASSSVLRSTEDAQSDDPATAFSADYPFSHLRRQDPVALKVLPLLGCDLSIGMKVKIQDGIIGLPPGSEGSLVQKWLHSEIRQPLVVRDAFANRGAILDAERPMKKHAILVFMGGVRQRRPCKRCQRNAGPFPSCVVGAGYAKGACTNCSYGGEGKSCNYHQQPQDDVTRWSSSTVHPPLPDRPQTPVSNHTSAPSSSAARASSPAAEPADRSSVDLSASRHDAHSAVTPASSPPAASAGSLRRTQPSPELGEDLDTVFDKPIPHRKRARSNFEQASPAKKTARPPPERGASSVARALLTAPSRESKRRKQRSSPSGLRPTESSSTPGLASTDHGHARSALSLPGGGGAVCAPRSESLPMLSKADFQHPGCATTGIACTDARAGSIVFTTYASSSRLRGMVENSQQFSRDNPATSDQVRFIISQSSCYFAQFFEDAWQRWVADRKSQRKPNKYSCKELYVAKVYCDQLNDAVRQFCSGSTRPTPPPSDPKEPIVIEDD